MGNNNASSIQPSNTPNWENLISTSIQNIGSAMKNCTTFARIVLKGGYETLFRDYLIEELEKQLGMNNSYTIIPEYECSNPRKTKKKGKKKYHDFAVKENDEIVLIVELGHNFICQTPGQISSHVKNDVDKIHKCITKQKQLKPPAPIGIIIHIITEITDIPPVQLGPTGHLLRKSYKDGISRHKNAIKNGNPKTIQNVEKGIVTCVQPPLVPHNSNPNSFPLTLPGTVVKVHSLIFEVK